MAANGDSTSDVLKRAVADHKAGRFAAAERGYRSLLHAAPGHFDALHLLGVLKHQTGHHGEAAELIDRAIAVNGRFAEAHFNHAAALTAEGKADAAIEALQRAVALKPDYADALLNLGVAMRNQGRLDEAAAAYRRAIVARPELAAAHNNLASLLETLGEGDQAVAHWRLALRHKPDYAEAYRNLAQHAPDAMSGDEIAAMERLVAQGGQPESALINLWFGLAEIYEARGDHDSAFAALDAGNAAKRKSIRFNIGAERSIVASMIDGFAEPAAREGFRSDLPVFVVGMPRAGTTLVEQILASHDETFGAGELTLIGRLAKPFIVGNGRLPVWSWGEETDDLAAIGRRYVDETSALAPGARRVVDKMPQNFLFLGLIAAILPDAKVIHVRRDPVDTCLACYKRLFSHDENFAYDLAELGTYYRLYDDVMRHWKRFMPDMILEVTYEDLVAEPRPVIEAMLDHVGLDWRDACLEFYRTKRPILTASAAQVRRPLYTSSVGRWRQFARHLEPLMAALGPLAPKDVLATHGSTSKS